MAPGLENNFGSIESFVMTSLSLRICNTTPSLYNGGQLAQFQLPKGETWEMYANNWSLVSQQLQAKVGSIKKGGCSTMRPVDVDYQIFREEFEAIQGVIYSTFVNLDREDTPMLFYGQFAPPPSGSSSAAQGFYEVKANVEYVTSDPWRSIRVSEFTEQDWQMAIQKFSRMQQHRENPIHIASILADIKGAVKSVIGGIQKYGPFILEAASAVAPLL
jgi:hypothetical protein